MSDYATDAVRRRCWWCADDTQALAETLSQATWPDGTVEGFPTRTICWFLAEHVLASGVIRPADDVRAETWPCANYTAPITCLTAPSSEPGRCDWCTALADAVRAEIGQEHFARGAAWALGDDDEAPAALRARAEAAEWLATVLAEHVLPVPETSVLHCSCGAYGDHSAHVAAVVWAEFTARARQAREDVAEAIWPVDNADAAVAALLRAMGGAQ